MASGLPSNPLKKIRLVRIAHVWYKHENIESAKQFALDFGFVETAQVGKTIFYRGYGTEPFVLAAEASNKNEFGGAAFVVESEEDLVHASKTLPKECRATEVHEMKDVPGGGKRVTFYDPVDGFPFHLVHGQTPVALEDPGFPMLKFNYVSYPARSSHATRTLLTHRPQPVEKNRGPNQFQRFQKRPAPVHKLGHFGMCVTNFAKCYEFYSSYFNFHPSEVSPLPFTPSLSPSVSRTNKVLRFKLVHNDQGVDNTVFFRLDRGDELVDHHCFFFFEGPKMHVHHSSFETHDFDAQVLGHDWLRHKGYTNCWGVGRHVMGSQIFDYWYDALSASFRWGDGMGVVY
jgi:hypothetical protein